MPRQARLDAPGSLHHVIVRGIEKRPIVDDDKDRKSFVDRMGSLALEMDTAMIVKIYKQITHGTCCFLQPASRQAWAFVPKAF